ncbi:Beta-lactamase-like domain-containing protein [Strongyloides ratti]|uniref:Beta-lactamase-like domain-containing protein n=1 Tax=Strongyloides ratti TaxID=34506 RepID=A0A090LTL7_STRRB|nr:Beta-lactamase-like domain-containing protein [Strongyloides ratti]CEF70979.1 Beta-lactamase-like domain-containing protein [Strongyloides ratti]
MIYLKSAFVSIFYFTVIFSYFAQCASTENLKQWIINNRNSLPVGAQEAIISASESDFTSTILKLLGFNGENEVNDLSNLISSYTSTEEFGGTGNNESKIIPTNSLNKGKEDSYVEKQKVGVKVSERDVCPFNADPLIITGDYVYCKQSNIRDCPIGFICDKSFVLGNTICCQDLRPKTPIVMPKKPNPVFTTIRPTYEWSTKVPVIISTPITVTPNIEMNIKINKSTNIPLFTKEITTIPTSSTKAPSSTSTTTEAPKTTVTQKTKNPWNHLWTTTPVPDTKIKVSVLQAGNIRILKDSQREMTGSITLVSDHGVNVLVDTGASSDTERLLLALTKEGVTLDSIDSVVITHGHPNHMGNLNFFGRKPILFNSLEYIGKHVIATELKDRPYRKITSNIEVWKTPGHTQHDLSVLVHGVNGYGTMAIVGDLIPSERFISEKIDVMLSEGVWDSGTKRQNANLIICMADWVIPGHGQPFRILPHYRQKAGCTRLLAQRSIKESAYYQQ